MLSPPKSICLASQIPAHVVYDWWGEGVGSRFKMMNDDWDLKTNQLLPSDADYLSQALCCPLLMYRPSHKPPPHPQRTTPLEKQILPSPCLSPFDSILRISLEHKHCARKISWIWETDFLISPRTECGSFPFFFFFFLTKEISHLLSWEPKRAKDSI